MWTQVTSLGCAGSPSQLKPFAEPPQHPDPDEESDQRAPGNYYELFAAAVGNAEWLRFCLNRKTGEIPTDSKGFTALHFAAQQCKLACLQVLVEEYKFPVNQPTNSGQTPLHLVIHRDNKTMVVPCIHYLLRKKAAINAQTQDGCTPLHVAAREGLLDCLKVLVENGANVHAQDVMDCKPIDFCKIWNHRTCARFLKDAMWRRDKKDFAHEMGDLKRLKGRLALLEQQYLNEYQKECKALNDAEFKKWLHCKLLLARTTKQKPSALTATSALIKTKCPGLQPSKSYHSLLEAHLGHLPGPTEPSKAPTSSLYRAPKARWPKLWDQSNNPARFPTMQITCLKAIRLGLQPEPPPERNLGSFVKVSPDRHGGTLLHTVTGHLVGAIPHLPVDVVFQELYPSLQPYRIKVPEGFYPISLRDVPLRQHLGNTFWTDALAMSLRETFDETFLTALRAHQGLLSCPPPRSSHKVNLVASGPEAAQ
ncbi:PREDICTED: ankyrin repeat domain-containing protein 53 [Chrysochloris asiatica]|uniref:Ankyrin repeat domain-containing protein 53 n=1 Tax=Chrysochloris asiatica TaxID=185453 RepID=A0A9B0TEM4_CHRAS|nr:PREDICTED: ankyrin repeat domain-containing protein 53 [Chrysochloris asiatica]